MSRSRGGIEKSTNHSLPKDKSRSAPPLKLYFLLAPFAASQDC